MPRKKRIREYSSPTLMLSSVADNDTASSSQAAKRVSRGRRGRREVRTSTCAEPTIDQGVDALTCDQANVGQAAYQSRRRLTESVGMYIDMGDMSNVCVDCSAMFWSNESKQVKKNSALIYTGCCQEGRVWLPPARPTPG